MQEPAAETELDRNGRRVRSSRCAFCQTDIADDRAVTIHATGAHGRGRETSCFCSARCRSCVMALAALHPSPLSPEEFIEQRTLICDGLHELRRRGLGPDPALVLRAAERAGHAPAVASAS